MTLAVAFPCKSNTSSSSPLVSGVARVEFVLLLEKGMEETLAEVEVEIVDASKRSAALPESLAMVATITARLVLAR